jgi:protein phosphatase
MARVQGVRARESSTESAFAPSQADDAVMSANSLHWASAARTHVGRVRELNEDACLELGERGLWAVADGMGGHAAGEVASRMVVDALRRVTQPESLGGLLEQVRRSMQEVNRALGEEASRTGQKIIGSTVAALLAYESHCVSVWAGDSRIYLLRNGQLRQLTRDHSQVEELVASGLVSREDARKLAGSNAITRAVGVTATVELDSEIHDVREGDTYLLCTDGLYNEVGARDMERILAAGSCREATDRLIQSALDHGARDNVSVVVVRADDRQVTKTAFNMSAPRSDEPGGGEDETIINPWSDSAFARPTGVHPDRSVRPLSLIAANTIPKSVCREPTSGRRLSNSVIRPISV